ncbi:MAG: integral membrane sensor signal transduction histidine kinase [Propionibacteriaceae bacterium]|nr:integral membrane sensor signal transduction histidine kinase [Propionibacteriaceae bacterium]
MAPTGPSAEIPAPAPTAAGIPPAWIAVSGGTRAPADLAPLNLRRLVWRLVLGALGVLVLVGVGSVVAASQLAEREAVNDAAGIADVLAEAVVQPALDEALAAGDPAAVAAFDEIARSRILSPSIVRVKLWSPQGRVVYADEPQLIGQTFPLDEDQVQALRDPTVRAEVSDLSRSENVFERGSDKLMEVYRPVWTPGGTQMLFEIYTTYEPVRERAAQLWRGLTGVMLTSLLVLFVLTVPILWRVFDRLRDVQQQREALLVRAVDASAEERRRIAASLHDGPVQDLVGTSFAVAGAAARAEALGDGSLAQDLGRAAAAVRSSIGSLRSLLVDIYPPSLSTAGLAAALGDLAAQAGSRGLRVELDLADGVPESLPEDQQRLVHRVTQECLRNAARHAPSAAVTVSLHAADGAVTLEVVDDGPGFDAAAVLAEPKAGHFGVRVLGDLVAADGARLDLAAAPGQGTRWRLTMPRRTS